MQLGEHENVLKKLPYSLMCMVLYILDNNHLMVYGIIYIVYGIIYIG